MARLESIYRYPVKGLNGQKLDEARLLPGAPIDADRSFAIAHGKTMFDPAAPVHLGKIHFLTLMTHPRLAELHAEFDARGTGLTLRQTGTTVLQADLATEAGRTALADWLDRFIGSEAKGAPRIVTAGDHRFADIADRCVSLQNLASIRALGERLDLSLDPLRFRGNLHIEGLTPWAERAWQADQQITIGPVRLRVTRPIIRCAATNVDPASAKVDANLPLSLKQLFDANLMGIYAQIVEGGTIRPGDPVEILPPLTTNPTT